MRTTNQNGFSVVEGLLIIVIVALLAGLGFYVMHQNSGGSSSASDQNSTGNSSLSSQDVGTIEGVEAVATAAAADDESITAELEKDSYNDALAEVGAMESMGDAVNESNL